MKSANSSASASDTPPAKAASPQAAASPTFIALAKVGRPYGLTGALHWYPYSQDAQTLLKAREGDVLKLVIPGKVEEIEVLKVSYPAPETS